MIYMFLSNNPSSGDINSSNLSCCLPIFSKSSFTKNSFSNTIRVSNSLDPDQARHIVWPDLGPNCLQCLSADNTSRQIFNRNLTFHLVFI